MQATDIAPESLAPPAPEHPIFTLGGVLRHVILIVIGVALLIAWGFNASGGAVLVAIMMHSAFNASSRFLDPFLRDTPTHEYPSEELFIAFAFLATAALVVVLTRGRLSQSCPN